MSAWLPVFASAVVGAALQEVLYWYEAYKSLSYDKYQALMKSPQYWGIVSAFIILTGVVAVIWYQGDTDPPKLKDVLIFGASLPLIVKQLVRSAPEQIKLGGSVEPRPNVSYFDLK